jgi:hypothetical protein
MSSFALKNAVVRDVTARRVALIITDITEERIASFIRATRIYGLETTLSITSNRSKLRAANVVPSSPILVTLMMEAIRSYVMSVLTRTKRCNTQEYGILHNHRRESLKYYFICTIRGSICWCLGTRMQAKLGK